MNNIISRQLYNLYRHAKNARLIAATLITLGISTIASQVAKADCTYIGPSERYFNEYRGNNPIQIDSSLPIGATLGTIYVASQGVTPTSINCTADFPTIRTTSIYPEISPGLYQTGTDGIGVKVISYNQPGGPLPADLEINSPTQSIFEGTVFQFIFIKTGYIPSSGQLNSGLVAEASDLTYNHAQIMRFYLPQPIILNLVRPTCTVNTPNFTVDLGNVSIADFNASGRTSPKNFSIDLTCIGGTKSADVHVTLTDANNPGNTSSQLGLSPDSDALGIALEVNNQFGVVNFGPDLNGIGNHWTVARWLYGRRELFNPAVSELCKAPRPH